jgi:Xaa-Pro aminopeptidase
MVAMTRPGVRGTDLRRMVNVRCAEAGATYVFCHIGSSATADPMHMYPDYYPTDRKVNAGDVLHTELCLGFGNYWGKIWGTWFCGQPPADYATMFADAADMHDRLAATIKPGGRAAEFDRYALELKAKGYDLHYPLLSGWSSINHDPQAGGVAGEKTGNLVAPYRDWQFRAGEPYTLCVWITRSGTERGVWVGTSGAISDSGFERFNTGFPSGLPVA